MKQLWKQIPDYPDYEISNLGHVMSRRTKKVLVLKPQVMKNKRHYVSLHNDNGSKLHLVHRLVAEMFIENPECHPIVIHLNGPDDNSAASLRWAPVQERKMAATFATVLNDDKVRSIRKLCDNTTVPLHVIGGMFGVSKSTVWRIARRQAWQHVNDDK